MSNGPPSAVPLGVSPNEQSNYLRTIADYQSGSSQGSYSPHEMMAKPESNITPQNDTFSSQPKKSPQRIFEKV
jgi:hypothetical protein